MRSQTYRQKVAKHLDRNYSKKELIEKYLRLAERIVNAITEEDKL